MSDFEILARGPHRRDQIHLVHQAGNRVAFDPATTADIDLTWRDRLAQATRDRIPLFDGPLFRLIDYRHDPVGGLHLAVGDTSYKEYVGTRAADFCARYPRDLWACPLAVCAAVVTSDGAIAIGRRRGVDVAEGQYHVFGGFLERGRDSDPFLGVAREIEEELGLALSPDQFICLGLIADCLHPHAELCFAARAPITFADLGHRSPRHREVEALEALPVDHHHVAAFLAREHDRISPSGEACLVLIQQLREPLRHLGIVR